MIRSTDIDPDTGKKMYEICDDCNYAEHRCYFCGTDLTHDGYEYNGKRHWAEDCRPDLFDHEPGPLCTWPDDSEMNQYREPGCYWDHEKGELRSVRPA